jgi:hypothetical protein
MSAREDYQPSLIALDKAISNFDEVAVKQDDAFARQQYLDLVQVVHTIKTYIVENEAEAIEGFDPNDIGC